MNTPRPSPHRSPLCRGLALSLGIGLGPAAWALPQSRQFSTNAESAAFEIAVSGTADHIRMGGWVPDPSPKHNPTRRLRIANTGERDLHNPRVITDGARDWFNIQSMVNEFIKPGMSDEEKAFALWQWCRHAIEGGPTWNAPIWGREVQLAYFMSAFGTGACGTYHAVMPHLGRLAGLNTFAGCLADCSHAVQKEEYGGQDRYFDAHISHDGGQPRGWFALKLDNREIAGVNDIMEDRYLIDRVGGGVGRMDYVMYWGPGSGFDRVKEVKDEYDMGFTLRPGESIQWSWAPATAGWKPPEEIRSASVFASGTVEYSPRLDAGAADPAPVAHKLSCPYPISGASIDATVESTPGGKIAFTFSFNGNDYTTFRESDVPPGASPARIAAAVPDNPGFHEKERNQSIWLRVALAGGGDAPPALKALTLSAGFQTFRPSLPSLHAGRNTVRFEGTWGASPPESEAADPARALVNGNFEIAERDGAVPRGWTAYGRTDGVYYTPWYGGIAARRGRRIFGAAASWDAKTGGIHQQVSWKGRAKGAGATTVKASIFINTRGDSTAGSACRIGLDPTGGTDPAAGTVRWSGYARSNEWREIETPPVEVAPDAAPRVTVFLEHRHANDGDRFNISAFDDCRLTETAPAPAEASPPGAPSGVLIEYDWEDLPDLPVPQAPKEPVFPKNGGTFGLNQTLRWSPAPIAGAGAIDNHEILISPREDLAWPVVPNTHRYTNSADPGFALLFPDVLRPGATYYWKVRGRSADGVWGEWSDTWSFTASGPGAPRALQAVVDAAAGTDTLVWQPPADGNPAHEYEIYASGEHGFSPLRAPETYMHRDIRIDRPATFIATTRDTRLNVADRPEAFYRVVAVDKDGNRGVPTPVASLPTPALLSAALPPATPGAPYAATVPARLRTGRWCHSLRQGPIVEGADAPEFSLEESTRPPWLAVDRKTGALSGTPAGAEPWKIKVTLKDGRGGACERVYEIGVGR